MILILWDPQTLLHQTVELLGSRLIPALESSARIEAITKAINGPQYEVQEVKYDPQADERQYAHLCEIISKTHSLPYMHHLRDIFYEWLKAGLIKQDGHVLPECFIFPTSTGKEAKAPKDPFARAGYYAFDMSSGIMSDSFQAIICSAQLAHRAANGLITYSKGRFPFDTLVALCRPPGHHCDGRRAGGYCYINNAAVAVSTWRHEYPDSRIGILDIDFHHGNGTQEIFYADPKVLYASIHGEDEFPYYTGAADEIGTGDAKGTNINLPLKVGSSVEVYMDTLKIALEKLVAFRPEFLVVSLGFDTFHSDPLGYFQIHTEDYAIIAEPTRKAMKNIPALILLEGGYVIEHLGANMMSFLNGWTSAGDPETQLPQTNPDHSEGPD